MIEEAIDKNGKKLSEGFVKQANRTGSGVKGMKKLTYSERITLRELTGKAINKLAEILNMEGDDYRLLAIQTRAAEMVLDRNLGKPVQMVQQDVRVRPILIDPAYALDADNGEVRALVRGTSQFVDEAIMSQSKEWASRKPEVIEVSDGEEYEGDVTISEKPY